MRLFMLVLLCFNVMGNAYAEDLGSSSVSALQNDRKANVLVNGYVKDLGEPSVSALQIDTKDSTKVANDHLFIMREEIKKSAVKKSSFSFFGTSETPLELALLKDLNDYLTVYGTKSLSVEAVQLKAILHNRMDKNEALAMDYLTMISAYSGSRYEKASRHGLQGLLDDPLKLYKTNIDTLLNHDFSATANQSDRLFTLLSGLSPIDSSDFNPVIAAACSQFLLRFPNDAKDDVVQNILAAHAGEQYHVGIYHYRTLLAVYPESTLRPDALFAIGEIQRTGLKAYENAVVTYQKVIQDFPRSDVAKQSYIKLALTQSQHLRTYQKALVTLNTAVEKYADDPIGKEALQMLGEIYSKKTKEYGKAVASYRKLSVVFPGEDGLKALQDAEKIASSSMHDYALVIAIDEQVIRDYANNPLAAEKMMNIATIYKDKLKQKSEAIQVYQRVIESYPNSKEAKKASSNIRKLENPKGKLGLF